MGGIFSACLGIAFSLFGCSTPTSTSQNEGSPPLPPVPYSQTCASIEKDRLALAEEWKSATPTQKKEILNQAKSRVEKAIVQELFPYWVGTPWDFNGTTQTPGEGQIACGYFLSTLLRDAGFQVERAKLAQQASSNIMKSMAPGQKLTWLSQIDSKTFAEKAKAYPHGLYILGLDIHTGFLWVDETSAWFVHSNYVGDGGVTKEKASESVALSQSKIFVVGKLTTHEETLIGWLENRAFPTVQ